MDWKVKSYEMWTADGRLYEAYHSTGSWFALTSDNGVVIRLGQHSSLSAAFAACEQHEANRGKAASNAA
jgi:hypothetical protein